MISRAGGTTILAVGLYAALCALPARPVTVITVTNAVRATKLNRIGLGMGGFLESSPVLKNLVPAPGFEPGHYASVVIATNGTTGAKFKQKYTGGLATQPAGFWDGARYEVVEGVAQGRNGTVASFTHENEYTFNFDSDGVAPEPDDVMVVDMDVPGFKGETNLVVAETRPGSTGVQSYKLASGANLYCSVDTMSKVLKPSAGKMFLVKGNWRIEFWARASRAGTAMTVQFFRGSTMFLNTQVALDTYWRKYAVDTYVAPGADPYATGSNPSVDVMVRYDGPVNTHALIDELAAWCVDNKNPTAFSDTYVSKLLELQPGIMRFWGGQFGSDLDSMIGDQFARKTVGYQPKSRVPSTYTFGFHDLLELSKLVGAEPWWVMPTMFTSQDFCRLVEYLAAPADGAHPYADTRARMGQVAPWTEVFGQIHLEFGNEIWGGGGLGDPFTGSSVGGGKNEGAISHYRFGIMKSCPYFDSNTFDLVVGGQQAYPGQNNYIERMGSNHTSMAISTYFWSCNTVASDNDLWPSLYAWPFYTTRAGVHSQTWAIIKSRNYGTKWSTYEMDFSSGGSQSGAIKNQVLAGAGGGIAMPLHAIMNQYEFNARAQCAFSEFGFEYPDGSRLHGVYRDFEGTGRMRPKGYACAAANKAIMPTMVDTVQSGDNPGWTQSAINGVGAPTPMKYVSSFAYRDSNAWSLILFNFHMTTSLPVRLSLPVDPDTQAELTVLTSDDIRANNEDALNVTNVTTLITDFANDYELVLRPFSQYVLRWRDTGTPRAPSNLVATAAAGGADLSWDDAASGESGFIIERADDWGGYPLPHTWKQAGTAASNATSYTDATAGAGVPRWYRVRSFSSAGPSEACDARRVITGGGAVPAAPASVSVSADTPSSALITWIDASANEDGFVVELAPDVSGLSNRWDAVASTRAGATSFHIEHLVPETRYAARVRAFNTTGTSGYSVVRFISRPGFAPTNTPANIAPPDGATGEPLTPSLVATDCAGPGQVAAQWQVSLFSNFPSTVWDSGEDATQTSAASVPPGALLNGIRYYWRVRYKLGADTWTPWSAPTSFKTERQTRLVTLTATRNALIRSNYLTNNYSSSRLGSFSGLTPGGVMAGLVLVMFDTSAYAGERVAGNGDFANGLNWAEHPYDITLYDLRKGWNEDTVTWQNYVDGTAGGAGYTNVVGGPLSAAAVGNTAGPYHWPVPRAVIQAWLDDPATNFGIGLGSSYANTLFASRTYHNAPLRPRLDIALETGSTIGTPTNALPAQAAAGVPLAPMLVASPFCHPNNGHAASRWQLATSADFTVPLWDSGIDATSLTNAAVAPGLLDPATRYFWRVCYADNDPESTEWSLWSSPTYFDTEVPEPIAAAFVLLLAAGTFRGRIGGRRAGSSGSRRSVCNATSEW